MEKNHKILLGIGILCIIAFIFLYIFGFVIITTNVDRVLNWCEQNNISQDCYVRTPECFYDCKSLNLEYFKLNIHTGLFHGEECYCKINSSEVKKIW